MSTGFIEGCLNELDRFISIEDYLSPESPRLLRGAVAARVSRSRGVTVGGTFAYEKKAEVEEIAQVYEGKEFLSLGDRTKKLGSYHARRATAHVERPDVELLETILREHYNNDSIIITGIRNLLRRKDVKEVHFKSEDDQFYSHVWLMRANPLTITTELTFYYLIHDKSPEFPTAIPIAFNPKKQKIYPYKHAILGGITENVGDSFDDFMQKERFNYRPEEAINAGKVIERHIADLHSILNGLNLGDYGIELEEATPERELNDRLFAAVDVKPAYKNAVIDACTILYNLSSDDIIVSHGDMHLAQVLTLKIIKDVGGKPKEVIDSNRFGIIDFDRSCRAKRLFDPLGFDIHFQRKLQGLYDEESDGNGELIDVYARASCVDYDRLNLEIQKALLHVGEMYDPVRKNPRDIQQKAEYHLPLLMRTLHTLENFKNIKNAASGLKKAIGDMIRHTPQIGYLIKFVN